MGKLSFVFCPTESLINGFKHVAVNCLKKPPCINIISMITPRNWFLNAFPNISNQIYSARDNIRNLYWKKHSKEPIKNKIGKPILVVHLTNIKISCETYLFYDINTLFIGSLLNSWFWGVRVGGENQHYT